MYLKDSSMNKWKGWRVLEAEFNEGWKGWDVLAERFIEKNRKVGAYLRESSMKKMEGLGVLEIKSNEKMDREGMFN